jgi:cytochrome c553
MRLTVVVFALLAASACQRSPAQLTYEGANAATQTAKIAHGKRLADVPDCTGCHGANQARTWLTSRRRSDGLPNLALDVPPIATLSSIA